MSASIATLKALCQAFNDHDLDRIMSFFADDAVLEMPRGPDPWGRRHVGAKAVREGLAARFEGLEEDLETRKLIAAAVAAEQVFDLLDHGVTEFHFYTMNRADLVFAICHLLGLRAQPEKERAAA